MDGYVAVVTGGGTGIGAAAARLLAERGVSLALVGRRRERLEEVAGAIDAKGGQALAVAEDLADGDAPRRIVASTLARFGRIDIVVNNAAAFHLASFGTFGLEAVDHSFAVNFRAPFLLIEEALPALEAAPSPAVVNVSSSAAAMHRDTQALYGATKFALEHLTRSLAVELGPRGIRVNCIQPGPTDTEIHLQATDDPSERLAKLEKLVPLGRIGQPEEVARWIVEVADPRANAWLTGTVIPVDGGRAAGSPAG